MMEYVPTRVRFSGALEQAGKAGAQRTTGPESPLWPSMQGSSVSGASSVPGFGQRSVFQRGVEKGSVFPSVALLNEPQRKRLLPCLTL